jgi:hypothetical protein
MRKFVIDQFGLAKTVQQIDFARGMNAKQWSILEALTKFRFPLSVSEWSDPDVIALFKNGLVSSDATDDGAAISWAATEAGSNLVQLRAENPLVW